MRCNSIDTLLCSEKNKWSEKNIFFGVLAIRTTKTQKHKLSSKKKKKTDKKHNWGKTKTARQNSANWKTTKTEKFNGNNNNDNNNNDNNNNNNNKQVYRETKNSKIY